MREADLLCLDTRGYHRMHYYDWGDADNPRVLICVHGLTRNGRDFDAIAESLSSELRVVCPDIAGRGLSPWLENKADYNYPQYLADVSALIARVTTSADQNVAWLGTSMGGILGMMAASRPHHPISRMVVNDVGTLVPKAALQRLARFVGKEPRFPSLEELEAGLRRVSASFGPLTDTQWRHLTLHGSQQHEDGTWGVRYDPAIGAALAGELSDVDLSSFWDAITCPTLVVRGADSDLLLRETAEEMTRRGPRAALMEFANVGHAPMLMDDEQIAAVRTFLLQ